MKIYIVLLLLFIVPFHSQTITGKIENENGRFLSDVNVYIDGTQIATISKSDGSFELDIKGQIKNNLNFQKDNYEQKTLSISKLINTNSTIKLIKYQDIEEVVVVPKEDKAYKKYIQYFLDTFIGNDQKNVTIFNVKTLKFYYDKDNQTLLVRAPKTLIIENKNLGYTIQYNLVNYKSDLKKKIVSYYGTSFFIAKNGTPEIKMNRMNAYDGSLQHFMQSAYSNKIAENGFILNHIQKITNPNYSMEEGNKERPFELVIIQRDISSTNFIQNKNGSIYLSFKDILQVNFKKYSYFLKDGIIEKKTNNSAHLSTKIFVEGNTFEIFPWGYTTNPENLLLEGDFSKFKIEKFLPLDYILGD